MTDYRTYLDRQGVPRGPWVVRDCDSNSDPQGENSRSEVECEASQSGVSESERIAHNLPSGPSGDKSS